jgi:hypothetical protein
MKTRIDLSALSPAAQAHFHKKCMAILKDNMAGLDEAFSSPLCGMAFPYLDNAARFFDDEGGTRGSYRCVLTGRTESWVRWDRPTLLAWVTAEGIVRVGYTPISNIRDKRLRVTSGPSMWISRLQPFTPELLRAMDPSKKQDVDIFWGDISERWSSYAKGVYKRGGKSRSMASLQRVLGRTPPLFISVYTC